MDLNKEEIECLINFSQWMFDDGMVNFTYEDMVEFERIKKKWENYKKRRIEKANKFAHERLHRGDF